MSFRVGLSVGLVVRLSLGVFWSVGIGVSLSAIHSLVRDMVRISVVIGVELSPRLNFPGIYNVVTTSTKYTNDTTMTKIKTLIISSKGILDTNTYEDVMR